MDPMQKVSIHYCNLTKKERATCDLIMENPEVVIHNPIAEAAEIYPVSPSSILRLSKKIGYKGYSEFRYALEGYYNHRSRNQKQTILSDEIIDIYQSSFNELRNSIDESKIIELVHILQTKNFKTVGIGNSSLAAKQLIYSLYVEDYWGECVNDSVKVSFLDKTLTPNDAIIVFSVSGNHDLYYKEMKKWKESGATIVLVTTNPESQLCKLCQLSITLPSLPLTLFQSPKQVHYLENRTIFYVFIDILLAYFVTTKTTNQTD